LGGYEWETGRAGGRYAAEGTWTEQGTGRNRPRRGLAYLELAYLELAYLELEYRELA